MAILGGAGNPVGGSFTGPAEALELVGSQDGKHKFAYAYSGPIPLNNETKTALNFTSGNYLARAKIQHTLPAYLLAGNKSMEVIVSLNGSQIIRYATGTNAAHAPFDIDPLYFIIPPYTEVKVEVATNDTQDLDNFVTLTARIYR